MEKPRLQLERRQVIGKKVKRLRLQGVLPATVYGKGVEAVSVQTDARAFAALYSKAGRSTLIELIIPDMPVQSAFIHAVQRHPVTRNLIHADLRVVDLKVAITVDVPIRLVGESPLVAKGQATLNNAHHTLYIQALPTDIPQHIEIDLEQLTDLEKEIRVRDLPLPAGITVLTDADDLVVSLLPARLAEEPTTDSSTSAEPELIRDRKDGE